MRLAEKEEGAALNALLSIPSNSMLYTSSRIESLKGLKIAPNPTLEEEILEDLSNLDHPREKGASLLYYLAKHIGLSNAEAYPFLLKIWAHYPSSDEQPDAYKAMKVIMKKKYINLTK